MPESPWQYLDQWHGKDVCIFSLSLSPAQEFIEEARKSRDLRAGSLLLSWLSFKLYEPILKQYQETAFIVPACAGNPFFEEWKKQSCLELEQLQVLAIGGNSITNRAVGLIERQRLSLLQAAEENCCAAWDTYAKCCKKRLTACVGKGTWQPVYERQMQDFSAAFTVYAVAADANLNNLPSSIQNILAQMERRKDSRLFKQWQGSDMQKCTQCGHREIIAGSDDLFWQKLRAERRYQDIIRFEGGRELLCACCLAKRLFAFDDTIFSGKATASTLDIAAAPFLSEFRKLTQANLEDFQLIMDCWQDDVAQHIPDFLSSKPFTDDAWLKKIAELVLPYELEDKQRQHVETANRKYLYGPTAEDNLGLARPSPYLAVLMLDGDNMGEKLSQHPELSSSLTKFSQAVPKIIEHHKGTAIYSSGDELLALLPKDSALSAAQAVQAEFSALISAITCSAAVTWFHCKDPLQQAVRNCRSGLKLAKDGFDRNSFVCTILTSSAAEHCFGSPWNFDEMQVPDELAKLIHLLKPDGGLSKNFLHDLLEELPSFVDALPVSLFNSGAEKATSAVLHLIRPRLRYLWQRHGGQGEEDCCRFLEGMATTAPRCQYNRAANFAACLRVAGFLARS